MAQVRVMRVALSGDAVVGGGVMTFYNTSETATGWPAAVKQFLNAAPLMWPTALTFTVPNVGDVIEHSTGELLGSWTDGPAQAAFSGTNTGDWAAGVGIRVVWETNNIHSRRRFRGSNFLVPVAAGIFDTNGTVDEATRTERLTAATAYIASQAQAAVYARPKPERPKKGGGTLPQEPGFFAPIITARIPDKVSWLRSRRV